MNSVLNLRSDSDEETREIGRRIGRLLPKQGVVLLIGELGAGKTTLTKGIVEGRGAASSDDVSSPTFTLIHEYGDPVSVYHADLYRLDSAAQVRQIGLDELFERPAQTIVEWGERFPELFPPNRVEIRLHHVGEGRREIEVFGLAPG